jgi:hypothetical protein
MISGAKPARLDEADGSPARQNPSQRVALRLKIKVFEKGTIIGLLHDRVPQN